MNTQKFESQVRYCQVRGFKVRLSVNLASMDARVYWPMAREVLNILEARYGENGNVYANGYLLEAEYSGTIVNIVGRTDISQLHRDVVEAIEGLQAFYGEMEVMQAMLQSELDYYFPAAAE